MLYQVGDSRHTQNIQLSVESHLHQLGYIHHFDVWVSRKLSKKTFLTVFPHAILYLTAMKMFRFKTNCDGRWIVDTVQ